MVVCPLMRCRVVRSRVAKMVLRERSVLKEAKSSELADGPGEAAASRPAVAVGGRVVCSASRSAGLPQLDVEMTCRQPLSSC